MKVLAAKPSAFEAVNRKEATVAPAKPVIVPTLDSVHSSQHLDSFTKARRHVAVSLPAAMQLQQSLGNQAVQRGLESGLGSGSMDRLFQLRPVIGNQAMLLRLQAKLKVNTPGDHYEQEADRVAERVMRMPAPDAAVPPAVSSTLASPAVSGVQRKCASGGTCSKCQEQQPDHEHEHLQMKPAGSNTVAGVPAPPIVHEVLRSPGRPLDAATRAFMEPRFGLDFSQVRVHTDLDAVRMNGRLNAQAFTHNQHIYYGAGKFPGTNTLTAHELTHVAQQARGGTAATAAIGGLQGHSAQLPSIQRVLEVRPPGRGEGSAFERRHELIDRLNAQSRAIQYRLDGRQIRYDVIDAAALMNFDRQMQQFIDRAELVPMRLTTGADRVGNRASGFVPLVGDSLRAGNVDLDDLMADDDFSFRSDLVHFLTERFSVRNYARRIGTNISDAEFDRGHQRGHDAEAALLQELFNDPSIQFWGEERDGTTFRSTFLSRAHGYKVFQVVRGTNRDISGGKMFVVTRDRRRVSMEDFRAERAGV